MPTKSVELPCPTPYLVASYVETFNQKQAVVERALTKLFTLFPENIQLEHVLIKVVALNDLYRTGILATFQVAEHVFRLNIDQIIKEGKSEAVELIGHVHLGKGTRKNYSFATKYCAWHNPEVYPMYDSFVDQMLWGVQATRLVRQVSQKRSLGVRPLQGNRKAI